MKKTIYFFASAIVAVLVFIACSKDQKVVNQLEGTWKVTAESKDGVAQPDSTFNTTTYTFEKCKVKKGECPGNVNDFGKSFPFTYSISDKGTKLKVTMLGVTSTSDILEHSKTKFRWRTDEDGEVWETTIEKQ